MKAESGTHRVVENFETWNGRCLPSAEPSRKIDLSVMIFEEEQGLLLSHELDWHPHLPTLSQCSVSPLETPSWLYFQDPSHRRNRLYGGCDGEPYSSNLRRRSASIKFEEDERHICSVHWFAPLCYRYSFVPILLWHEGAHAGHFGELHT